MNECDDCLPTAIPAEYRGVPDTPTVPGESSRWRKFLEWAMPWLKHKWDLGDRVISARAAQEVAKAAQEQAKARQMMAEARQAEVKVAQDTLRTITMAREMEREKLAGVDLTPATPSELEQEMRDILAKMQTLGWKYGSKFHFEEKDTTPEATGSASSPPLSSPLSDSPTPMPPTEISDVQ
jgi:hypothetical protein